MFGMLSLAYLVTLLNLMMATRAVDTTPANEGVWMVRKRMSQRYELAKPKYLRNKKDVSPVLWVANLTHDGKGCEFESRLIQTTG